MTSRRKHNLSDDEIRRILNTIPFDESEGEDFYSDDDEEFIPPTNNNPFDDDSDDDNTEFISPSK